MSRRANRELLRGMREDLEDEEFQDQLDDILEERYGYSQPYPMYPMMRPPVMMPIFVAAAAMAGKSSGLRWGSLDLKLRSTSRLFDKE